MPLPRQKKFRMESGFIGRNVRDKSDFLQLQEQIRNVGSVRRELRTLTKES